MWELGHKEGSMLKNWCFWIVVLEKTLKSPLDCKEIKLVNSKGNQPWIFIRKTVAKASILWPPTVRSQDWKRSWLMLGKIEGKRIRGCQRMRWLDHITNSMDMSWANSRRYWRTEEPGMLQSMRLQSIRHDLATERQQQQRVQLLSNRRRNDYMDPLTDISVTSAYGWGYLWESFQSQMGAFGLEVVAVKR